MSTVRVIIIPYVLVVIAIVVMMDVLMEGSVQTNPCFTGMDRLVEGGLDSGVLLVPLVQVLEEGLVIHLVGIRNLDNDCLLIVGKISHHDVHRNVTDDPSSICLRATWSTQYVSSSAINSLL